MTTTIAVAIIIRALIQALAGFLIAKGYIKANGFNIDEISGAVLFLLTIAWSWYSKKQLIQTTVTTPSTPQENGKV